ncbi:hypothetical protein [Leptolyngbya sp. GB1-A1]|uniref:hypothetical protein n=1 Tax=unclassified Leptolyngbya TaxID=2650499 RepID=UPI0019AFF562|nr:hypothetical protein [Cyanobacteria bacterium FACHB-502]
MSSTTKLAELITTVKEIGDASFAERTALFKAGKISTVKWELADQTAVLDYVKAVADRAGLTDSEKKNLVKEVTDLLAKSSPAKPTVHALELELINLRAKLNSTLLTKIIAGMSSYEKTINDASKDLKEALDKLKELNESFGAIAIVVSLVAAMVSLSSGKFNLLAKAAGNLL